MNLTNTTNKRRKRTTKYKKKIINKIIINLVFFIRQNGSNVG